MRKQTKERSEMGIEELILDSGWWIGTQADWQALPMEEREEIAFLRTGCEVAYPTWERPVDCVHTECQIRRGELPKIALTNQILKSEATSGWLRFIDRNVPSERKRLADIFKAYRKAARETGQYDPWKLSWGGLVYNGISV